VSQSVQALMAVSRGAAKDALLIKEIAAPTPAPNEVLVRMHTSGINPSDIKVRIGAQGPMVADEVIVHNDGAGEILETGSDVSSFSVGQRVWLFNVNRSTDGLSQGVNGTASQIVRVPQEYVAALPENVSYESGACLGVPAMTAHRAVFCHGSVENKVLFIPGGAGSVGQLAVQMAKAANAHVVTTVSSDVKQQIAQDAGADLVINYKEQSLKDELLKAYGQHGIDQIVDVDFAAHMQLIPELLKANGCVSAYASGSDLNPAIPYYPLMFRNMNLQLVFVYGMPDDAKKAAIIDINRFLSSGAISPRVDKVFELADAIAAHNYVESNTMIGNVVMGL